eukprot:357813_1
MSYSTITSLFNTIVMVLILLSYHANSKIPLPFYAITADSSAGPNMFAAQKVVMNQINENDEILGNYDISLEELKCTTKPLANDALRHSVNAAASCSTSISELHIPIILGCAFSSLTERTSVVLESYDWIQISGSATSTDFSTDQYPAVYRMIASDALQGKAIVKLCKQLNYTKIGVIYINDNYGQSFSKVIAEQVINESIEVHLFNMNEASFIKDIEEKEIFVIVIIAHKNNIPHLFKKLNESDKFGYPYFYIGTDGWFDKEVISEINAAQFADGFIGTVPAYPNILTFDEYKQYNIYNGNKSIYDKSQEMNKQFVNDWKKYYTNNKSFVLGKSEPEAFARYGADVLYFIANVMNVYDTKHNLTNYLNGYISLKNFTKTIENIMKNIWIIGATGNNSIDDNGDRQNGFYVFANYKNGQMKIFGAIADIENNFGFNETLIQYPYYFTDRDRIPITKFEIKAIKHVVTFFVMIIFDVICGISILLVIYLFSKVWRKLYRLRPFYIIQCFGCIFVFVAVIIYGFEYYFSNPFFTNYGCDLNLWSLSLIFTFVFSPLCIEAFRINWTWHAKKSKLKHCFIFMIGIFVIDILMILSYLFIKFVTNKQIYSFEFVQSSHNQGRHDENDYMVIIENQFCICSSNWTQIAVTFNVLIIVFKLLQLVIGIISAIFVFKQKTEQKYHLELLSFISCVVFILGICVIFTATKTHENVTTLYIILSIQMLISAYIILLFNILPYLSYDMNKDDEKQNDKTSDDQNVQSSDKTSNMFNYDHAEMTSTVKSQYKIIKDDVKEDENDTDDNKVKLG